MAKSVLVNLDFGNVAKITGLAAPTDPTDAVRLQDLNSAVEGLAWKDSCRVSTQSNVNLSSPGASIDGISLDSGDRVLVREQTDDEENGIYIWNGASVAMTRAPDASTADELEEATVSVEDGTSAGATFRQTSVDFTLDTDPIAFTPFGTSAPPASESTAGIIEIATQTETDTGTDDERAVTPEKLANWSGRKLKGTATIGDNSATSFTITHNFNTRDVLVAVYRNSGNYDEVEVEVRRNNVNSVDLLFATAPTTNQYKVVILG
jgi:hypothetical protein